MTPKPIVVLFFKGTALGGAELNGLKILEFLRQEGWSTRLITGSKGALFDRFAAVTDDQLILPFPYPRKPLSWFLIPRFYIKVKAFLDRCHGSQVLFCGDFYELWAVLRFRSVSRPLLSLWQGEYNFDNDSCVKKWLMYGARHADVLLASAPVAQHANGTNLLPSDVHTLNPCIDDECFSPNLYNGKELRKRFGWNETDHIAVCVGRIGEGKGQMWLAKAFIKEVRLPKVAKLLVVGPGSDSDLSDLRNLEAESQGRLMVLGPRIDIPEILAAADLAIQPGTLAESFGLAALEACMMDVPLLAFRVGALPFILGESYPGLVAKYDFSALMEKWIQYSLNQVPDCGKPLRENLVLHYGKTVWREKLLRMVCRYAHQI